MHIFGGHCQAYDELVSAVQIVVSARTSFVGLSLFPHSTAAVQLGFLSYMYMFNASYITLVSIPRIFVSV